jgi:hypothetical protein
MKPLVPQKVSAGFGLALIILVAKENQRITCA